MPFGLLGPRCIIAGTASGVGKTTVTTAVLSILHSLGIKVAPAKVGPDYIDPSYHELACGVRGRSLDTFLSGRNSIAGSMFQLGREADITVVEGVMGLFDGTLMRRADESYPSDIDSKITPGSTAEIAALTQTPVILVLDATATSSSLAAVLEGFCNFSPDVEIGGMIVNNIGSPSHLELVKRSTAGSGIELIGAIPRGAIPTWRSRHLGLVPVVEDRVSLETSIKHLRDQVGALLDISAIIEISKSAPPLQIEYPDDFYSPRRTKIAVARGKAFSFLYPENITALEKAGAEIEFFDPLSDAALPTGINGLYIGGGFPEIFADRLASNSELNYHVKKAVSDGLPTWAECGGLMWLSNQVDKAEMVGAIQTEISMTSKLTLGYARAQASADNCLSRADETIYGHEFHYSSSRPTGDGLALLTREGSKQSGFTTPTLFASYLHVHLGTQQHLADRFVSQCT